MMIVREGSMKKSQTDKQKMKESSKQGVPSIARHFHHQQFN